MVDKSRSRFRMGVSRVLSNPSFRSALFVFLLSRCVVLVIFVLVGIAQTIPIQDIPGHTDVFISVYKAPIGRTLRREILTADVNWYIDIASKGYEREHLTTGVPPNCAFFPLFPLVLWAASRITHEFVFTGMLLSHIFFFIALFLLHKTCLLLELSTADADRCVFYLSIFPVSYFLSLPLSESLYLMLTVGSIFFAKRGNWWAAGCLAAASSATRLSGIILLPTLLVLQWETRRKIRPFQVNQLAPLLAPFGLFAYMTYLYKITGNPLAFAEAQAAWGRKLGFFLTPLIDYLREPYEIVNIWDFRALNFAAAITVLICGVVLLKRRHLGLAFFTLGSVLLTLSSTMLQSGARYAMVVFPVFIVLATVGARERFGQFISAVFLVLFGLLTTLFALHFTMALS